jgi:subtilisin-like proprotein convertase family protein
MIAGMDGGYGQVWGNGQINYGTTHYFNEAHGIYSHTYLYPESGSHAADIVQNVSDGVAFINYTAHGSTTAWGNPSFTQGNINGLENYGEYCTAIGNCCLTSSYEVGECFAETWLRAEEKGAIGYIGASSGTWWDEDYYFGVGYTTNIVEYPVYEDTGIGAYDGLFHDHGEAMDQWYVVNDAIIFSGNLAVMESGSSGTTYYWNIYNLMGDPSIATYLGVPDPNPVVHPETIFTTWTSVTIEAVPGSYVGLTQDGELIGAGMIHESGSIDLPIWAQPLTPGPAHLVVMAQNREPYRADVNVIVPATVYIDPDEIDANVETEISVGVFEYDGVTPRPGIEVWAEGLDYECTHAFTDETGYCTITVNYPYGPTLDIVGQDPAEPWELFRNAITVNAEMWLPMPDLWVTTEIGLDDAFALNLPGTLHASVSVPGHTLWAFQNDEALDSTDQLTLDLTPTAMGDITGIVAVSGYDLYMETFPVIEAYGTLTGHVDADGSPGAGALVCGYGEGSELIFEVTADAQGNYDVGRELLVATYTITADLFGYLHWESEFFLNYGENVLDIDMLAAPSGILTGMITDSETGEPLVGTVKVYRSDTMELYAETTSMPDGTYTTPGLPYFDYVVTGKAWHHVAETINLTVDQAVHVHDFVLVPTIGDLLLLDDGSGDRECPAKLDPKTGEVVSSAYVRETSKAVADLQADLEAIGYSVTLEPVSGSDPGTWMIYDVLIVCSGNNTNALADAGVRGDLIDFVENEGDLLIEGGEVGYNHADEADFAQVVLHISDWDHDQSGNVTVAEPDHYVMSVPNEITGPISMSYSGYGDHDAVDPTPDAVKVGSWTDYPVNASLVAFDPNPAPAGGQIVFYAFNYSAMDADARVPLLENTITWLMAPEIADCAVSGLAGLAGETTHEGILVEAIPGGGSMITDATGAYTLENLYSGPYTIMASKEGWSTSIVEVYLEQGEHLTGVHHVLYPTAQEETCRDPNAYIGDYQTVTDGIIVLMDAPLTAVEIYVNITHTYQGDLTVDIRSPDGTTVRLHDRTGGSTDNIVGWYPGELEPAESLEAFVGESSRGVWMLIVEDHAGGDQGTLNSWCVRLTYPAEMSGAPDDEVRLPLALWANHPNPASPETVIRFDLPVRDDVELSIFDVTGRRVATLLSGSKQAGSHTTVWSGRNDAGQSVAGGLYFYRLRTSERTLTRKMTLLR